MVEKVLLVMGKGTSLTTNSTALTLFGNKAYEAKTLSPQALNLHGWLSKLWSLFGSLL